MALGILELSNGKKITSPFGRLLLRLFFLKKLFRIPIAIGTAMQEFF